MKNKCSIIMILAIVLMGSCSSPAKKESAQRDKISLNENWTFYRYDRSEEADDLNYDIRPVIEDASEYLVADAKPTDAVKASDSAEVLKPWVLPTANDFINDPQKHYIRPSNEASGKDFPFIQLDFNDSDWESVDLPHDWAIDGPFYEGDNPEVGGGMGRLPVQGVAWYRKNLNIPADDAGRSIFLEVEGAMSGKTTSWPSASTTLTTLHAGIRVQESTEMFGLSKHTPYTSVNGVRI